MTEPNAEATQLIMREISYLALQIDRALARKDTHVKVRVAALVTLMEVINMSTQVAKEQVRHQRLSFWNSLKELLRRY